MSAGGASSLAKGFDAGAAFAHAAEQWKAIKTEDDRRKRFD
jgi:hypothetical protein